MGKTVQQMLEDGVIEPSKAEWCSPTVPVAKPDGSVRVCIDYCGLNELTPLKRYNMPTLEDLLDQAGNCQDVNPRFNKWVSPDSCGRGVEKCYNIWLPARQIQIHQDAGLRNAPAVFQMLWIKS